jgi:hypothetical protein
MTFAVWRRRVASITSELGVSGNELVVAPITKAAGVFDCVVKIRRAMRAELPAGPVVEKDLDAKVSATMTRIWSFATWRGAIWEDAMDGRP